MRVASGYAGQSTLFVLYIVNIVKYSTVVGNKHHKFVNPNLSYLFIYQLFIYLLRQGVFSRQKYPACPLSINKWIMN